VWPTTLEAGRTPARWLAPVLAAALALAAGAAGAVQVASERVAFGLSQPLYATSPTGDGDRLFVVEQPGRIRILDISVEPPVLVAGSFLDIVALVEDAVGGEQGLLGLAFHPEFVTNRYFYVAYTIPGNAVRLSRFQVPVATPNDADETTELTLLTIPKPQTNHNGGWVAFGPDGYLYMAIGDGGGGGDDDAGHTPDTGNAQDITDNLLGKILRIDVDGNDGPGGSYGIPPTNPFVGVPGDDEIWAFGLRNPWRNAFDRLTGDLYIADVGQGAWEELSFQPASSTGGDNWGWRCREGAHDFNVSGPACPVATLLDPIHEYPHGGTPDRCAITGGEVYRGSAIPGLEGTYFFADFCSGQIWSLVVQGGVATQVTERTSQLVPPVGAIERVSSFGLDDSGEIYIVDRAGGEIFKIVPGPQTVPGLSPHGLVTVVLALLAAASFALRSGPGPARRQRRQ
jgi:glucose/arabinose dehydrogenase